MKLWNESWDGSLGGIEGRLVDRERRREQMLK